MLSLATFAERPLCSQRGMISAPRVLSHQLPSFASGSLFGAGSRLNLSPLSVCVDLSLLEMGRERQLVSLPTLCVYLALQLGRVEMKAQKRAIMFCRLPSPHRQWFH